MDLAERVSRNFLPPPWEHDLCHDTYICKKCGIDFWNNPVRIRTHCPIPDPIDITDLGKALECFRGLSNGKVMEQVENMYMIETNCDIPCIEQEARKEWKMTMFWWFIRHGTAEQIWEICCLAKEQSVG